MADFEIAGSPGLAAVPLSPRRTRQRKRKFLFQREEDGAQDIANRVVRFYEQDDQDRAVEKEERIQRYAKLRMWNKEQKDFPWPGASNVGLSDITEKSFRLQDTLHNAVMSTRPPIGCKATTPDNKAKEGGIDRLIDYQVFVEQDGESIVGEVADAFINDGHFVAFIPWVKEMRETSDVRRFDPIPETMFAAAYFQTLLQEHFPDHAAEAIDADGWDWKLTRPNGNERDEIGVKFYTGANDKVEMVVAREVTVHDGPVVIQKEWDEVLYPARAANLQIPGPSNPHGAGHVILVDYPTIDEIRRLKKKKIYDLLSDEDIETLEVTGQTGRNQEMREQKDDFQGVSHHGHTHRDAAPQKTLTRLVCFDLYDIDGDGRAEDVVWVVLLEPKKLARAKLLTELYPASKPRRPLVHRSMIPVRGRVGGISLPEQLEGLHDVMKAIIDQVIDAATMKILPPFFYRPGGTMNPEIINYSPGEGYPLGDPSRDVNFPTVGTQGEAMSLNLFTLLGQLEERLAVIGDQQFGRVPAGRASALRTIGGMAMLTAQGEARPERILRRFFGGLAEIWLQIHELNRHFLPKQKQIRVSGYPKPGEDPYLEVRRDEVDGDFLFEFQANAFNTSKQALQEGLQSLIPLYVSQLSIQLGIIDPDGIYRLLRDVGRAWGQDPDQYLKPPSPMSNAPKIYAEDAMVAVVNGQAPMGIPAEAGGAVEHLQRLQEIMSEADAGMLTQEQMALLVAWLQQVIAMVQQEQQQQAMLQAAGELGLGMAQGQPGRPAEGMANTGGTPPIEQNELLDETLPGARGGVQ